MTLPRQPWLTSRQLTSLSTRNYSLPARLCMRTKQYVRFQSTKPSPSTNITTTEAAELAATQARVARATRWTPKFFRKYVETLKGAPLTTLTSFLILHELTAIVPLFGLAGFFHYYNWLPPFFAEGAWVLKGVGLFSSWFRKRGWITDAEAQAARNAAEEGHPESVEQKGGIKQTVGKWLGRGETGTRWVVEFATAYAVVKAFLPLRLVVSVTWAPTFARWTVIPFTKWVRARFGRKKDVVAAQGAVKKS